MRPNPFQSSAPATEGPDSTAANNAARKLDLVTVIYRPELPLLKLQARSILKFFREDALGDIYVIVNEDDDLAALDTIAEIHRTVIPEYGHLSSRVTVLDGATVLQSKVKANGWRRQQTLKLLVSRTVRQDFYVVLDGKNHFIRPVGAAAFLSEDGRMKSFKSRQQGSLRQYFINACQYFAIDPAKHIDAAMPATTPFVLSRYLVKEMLDSIETNERTSFTEFFHAPRRNVTEFFLYFAYIISRYSIADFYVLGKRNAITLFTRWPDTQEGLQAVLKRLEDPAFVVFGLHSNRALTLTREAFDAIRAQWVTSGLFPDAAAADIFIGELQRAKEPARKQ